MSVNERKAFYLKVSGKLVMDGNEFDISQVDIEFELGYTGYATVYLPVGRKSDKSGMGYVGDVATILEDITPLASGEVYLKVDTGEDSTGAPEGVPDALPLRRWFLAFTGFVQAPAQMRSANGSVNIAINFFGYMGCLAGASMYSSNFMMKPGEGSGNPAIVMIGHKVGYPSIQQSILDGYGKNFLNIERDLWRDGIYLAITYAINATRTVWETDKLGGQLARAALERVNKGIFEGANLALAYGSDQQNKDVEITYALNKNLSWILARAVHYLWKYSKGTMDGDLLSVIRELQGEFAYTMVPAIDNDGLVPIVQLLHGKKGWRDVWRDIKLSEYYQEGTSLVFQEDDYAYITDVGILPSTVSYTPWQETAFQKSAIGHTTVNDIFDQAGDMPTRLVMVAAKPWMMAPEADALKGNNAGGRIPDSYNTAKVPASILEMNQAKLNAAYSRAGLGNRYAKTFLINNLFYNRHMNIQGRLRLDICPGSTVSVEMCNDAFLGQPDKLYGLVEKVKISVGVVNGNPHAYTSLVLSSVRSEKEQSKFTVEDHPMYMEGSTFMGAPLTQELK